MDNGEASTQGQDAVGDEVVVVVRITRLTNPGRDVEARGPILAGATGSTYSGAGALSIALDWPDWYLGRCVRRGCGISTQDAAYSVKKGQLFISRSF